MTRFRFSATDSRGIEWDDLIEAETREEAANELESRGLSVTSLRRVAEVTSEQLSFEISADEAAQLRDQKQRPPLGWPVGSVRALLTLALVFYVSVKTLMGLDVRLLWSESLMIAVAHYFTARRYAILPDSIRRDLVRMDLISADEHPLGLPKNTIRSVIFVAFVVMAGSFLLAGQAPGDEALGLLLTLLAFLLGHLFRGIWNLITADSEFRLPWWLSDLKALLTISLMVTALGSGLLSHWMPQAAPGPVLENIAAAAALFYFGSR